MKPIGPSNSKNPLTSRGNTNSPTAAFSIKNDVKLAKLKKLKKNKLY